MDHYNRLCFASEGTNSPVPAPLYFGFSLCTVAVYENGSISVTAFCSKQGEGRAKLALGGSTMEQARYKAQRFVWWHCWGQSGEQLIHGRLDSVTKPSPFPTSLHAGSIYTTHNAHTETGLRACLPLVLTATIGAY